MNEVLLCYVALPCTQQVDDLLNFLSITYIHPSAMKFTEGCGLSIYSSSLILEDIDRTEWVINDEDAPIVLAFYANKDFKGICTYLNNIPERPFDVYIDNNY